MFLFIKYAIYKEKNQKAQTYLWVMKKFSHKINFTFETIHH